MATIVDEVERRLRESGEKPYRREGERDQRWVLLDYIDVVVHVFHTEEREFYELERLWKDAVRIPFDSEISREPDEAHSLRDEPRSPGGVQLGPGDDSGDPDEPDELAAGMNA